MSTLTVNLRLAGVADPDIRFPGLPDGMDYDVAAVVAGRDALIRRLRAAGCPFPAHPESIRSVLADVDEAVEDADWTDATRIEVTAAIDLIRLETEETA